MVFREFNNTARVARNVISEEIVARSQRPGAVFEDIAELASGVRGRTRVLEQGQMDDGLWWAGQAQGLIASVATCEEIVTGIVADAEKAIGRLAELRD